MTHQTRQYIIPGSYLLALLTGKKVITNLPADAEYCGVRATPTGVIIEVCSVQFPATLLEQKPKLVTVEYKRADRK